MKGSFTFKNEQKIIGNSNAFKYKVFIYMWSWFSNEIMWNLMYLYKPKNSV
jgi:hypothetical protein